MSSRTDELGHGLMSYAYAAGGTGSKLLKTLYEETVDGYAREEPPSRPFDEVAQLAGVAQVGAPDSMMTKVALAFRGLESAGLVAKEKMLDQPLHYRITRMGERQVLEQRHAELSRELKVEIEKLTVIADDLRTKLRAEELNADSLLVQRDRLRDELEAATSAYAASKRPWWKRLFG